MSKGSKQEYKHFKINTLEDACLVLKGLIVPVMVHLEKYGNYSKESEKILLQYANSDVIPADIYDSIHDKLLYQQRELLRFMADHQSSSFSYIDIRQKFEKRRFLERKLSQESNEILNELLNIRNWSFHNAQSMLVADLELAKRSIPPELQGIAEIKPMLSPVVVPKVKSYRREMLEGFVHHNMIRMKQFEAILSEMKEDYQELFTSLPDKSFVTVGIGVSPKVQYVEQVIVGQTAKAAGSNIASVSMGIQKGKYDGTDKAIDNLIAD